MEIKENLKKAGGGLAAIVSGIIVAGCSGGVTGEISGGADYNRIVNMPPECEKVLSAGYSTGSVGFGEKHITDWISCEDSNGNVTIYRMPKHGNTWYQTEIKR